MIEASESPTDENQAVIDQIAKKFEKEQLAIFASGMVCMFANLFDFYSKNMTDASFFYKQPKDIGYFWISAMHMAETFKRMFHSVEPIKSEFLEQKWLPATENIKEWGEKYEYIITQLYEDLQNKRKLKNEL